jgi:hypothetical protein
MKRIANISFVAMCLVLGGCAKVVLRPYSEMPKPLVVPVPAKVGVVVTPETGSYIHKESRASVDYEAQLGESHKELVQQIFAAGFADARMFDSVDAARIEPGLLAIFEPRIEQFSFAGARETGGVYCAVTIRYQISIYAPNGEPVDTLTLTGYGSGPAPKIGNGTEELSLAAYAAMRDAAAKFLTQFPGLDVAKPLMASQALQPKVQPLPGSPEAVAAAADLSIETVPINDPPVMATTTSSPAPASSPAPPASVPPEASPPPSQMAEPFPATSP